jgi:hypothetical protein
MTAMREVADDVQAVLGTEGAATQEPAVFLVRTCPAAAPCLHLCWPRPPRQHSLHISCHIRTVVCPSARHHLPPYWSCHVARSPAMPPSSRLFCGWSSPTPTARPRCRAADRSVGGGRCTPQAITAGVAASVGLLVMGRCEEALLELERYFAALKAMPPAGQPGGLWD